MSFFPLSPRLGLYSRRLDDDSPARHANSLLSSVFTTILITHRKT